MRIIESKNEDSLDEWHDITEELGFLESTYKY